MLKGRRIALIGGAGFIGHNMALKLNELGAKVFIIDNLEVNNFHSIKKDFDNIQNASLYLEIIQQRIDLLKKNNIDLIEFDAREYVGLGDIIKNINVDSIIQLAAVAHAGKANKDPFSTFDHSLRTLENALDISRNYGQHFVFFSSSMVYGNFMTDVVTEESLCNPLGIYGALKYAGEKMVIAYNQVFDLPYTIIRPSALYGERCISRRVGQIFIENAIKGLEISINGDGSERLDFTYINDLVNGVVCVLTNNNSKNQTFNITYGQSRSISEMADILKEHFPDVKFKYLPKDKLMPDRGTLSVEKAKNLIGYQPSFPIEKGFVNYIEWYREMYKSLELA